MEIHPAQQRCAHAEDARPAEVLSCWCGWEAGGGCVFPELPEGRSSPSFFPNRMEEAPGPQKFRDRVICFHFLLGRCKLCI